VEVCLFWKKLLMLMEEEDREERSFSCSWRKKRERGGEIRTKRYGST
jgi:hypothetical protein